MPEKRARTILAILAAGSLLAPTSLWAGAAESRWTREGDPEILAWMDEINQQLEELGLGIAVESIEFFSIGQGRSSNRLHQQDHRWVAGDARRLAQGNDITYIVDQSGQGTASGVSAGATETATDNAMVTWGADSCLSNVRLVKRPDPGTDITIFDYFLGAGGLGYPYAADIVQAGWFPPGPPFFDSSTLAFSVSYIFMTDNGVPTDINGDNYLDTALNEVYNNDGFFWGINAPLPPTIDVETVELHELGHSLEVGHFGPPPTAVMNPVYAGLRHSLFPIDHAGMCTIWSGWPK